MRHNNPLNPVVFPVLPEARGGGYWWFKQMGQAISDKLAASLVTLSL